jgi:hypothetical protein
MHRSSVAFVGVLLATLAVGACDNGPDTGPTLPTTPVVTETFTGTINLNGSMTHPFNANGAGDVKATITALAPDGSTLGFQLGTWNTVSCTAVVSSDLSPVNSVLSGVTQSVANLCVKLYDPNGALTAGSVNYTVVVEHR